ncbi:MAG: LptF/LptG family permease, partial [Candidatus Competibacteraceae bacterium]|nr:LptF/LptG family permease [Candidatus Competibacteraceae bacterium]
DLSLRELLVYINYLKSNGLEPGPHQLAFWTKALGPISSLAMLFIAMPFVFAPQRTTTAGQRLVVGIFLGLLFYLGNRMLGNLVLLYGYPPLVAALLPSLLFFGAGTIALGRMR